jgi:GAF domain-containing protein
MRSGYVQLTGILLSSVLLVDTTVVVYLAGTIRVPIANVYILCFLIAGLLVSSRAAVVFTVLSLLALLGLTQAETAGLLPPVQASVGISQWMNYVAVFSMTVILLGLATRSINEALKRARSYAAELEEQRENLEEIVEERTLNLARRTRYLEATAAVTRDAASVLDLQDLLSRVVTSISEQFGFYHAGIFLLDPAGEWAVLQAASSEGGQRMLVRGHRLRVGAEGIVGYATGRGEPRIALDVGADAVYFDNPDLPETRSEMALPLRARGEIIGALDVQSTEPGAFDDEDAAVLQTLADQVAMAISNAQWFEQAQESLEAERRAYGELSREAWNEFLSSRPDLGFVKEKGVISPAGDLWEPQMEAALRTGRATPGDGGAATLAMPVKVRDQVVGVIDAHKPDDKGEWTPEEIALLETLADQLGVALEGARLYQDTQRRAARERLASEITARMRESLDMDTVLQTTVREMRRALELHGVTIHLGDRPKPLERLVNGPGQSQRGEEVRS